MRSPTPAFANVSPVGSGPTVPQACGPIGMRWSTASLARSPTGGPCGTAEDRGTRQASRVLGQADEATPRRGSWQE